MRYQIVRELIGTAIPIEIKCREKGNTFSIPGAAVFLQFGDGYKFICADCGFIMRGGSPATCGRCGKDDIIVHYD